MAQHSVLAPKTRRPALLFYHPRRVLSRQNIQETVLQANYYAVEARKLISAKSEDNGGFFLNLDG